MQTALDYHLMSQWTSFVAVEQRVVNVGGRQRTVDVPVEMPEGVSYEGIFGGESQSSSRELSYFGGPGVTGNMSSHPARRGRRRLWRRRGRPLLGRRGRDGDGHVR